MAARQEFAVQQPAGTMPPVLPPPGAQRTHGAPGTPGSFMMGAAQEAMGGAGLQESAVIPVPRGQLMGETGGGRQREGAQGWRGSRAPVSMCA